MIRWDDMLARVRRQLKDESGALRSDATLKGFILDAVRDLGRRRPEARLDVHGRIRGTPTEWGTDGTGDGAIPIGDYYEEALVALSLALVYLSDASDAKDESLGSFWQRRATELLGG